MPEYDCSTFTKPSCLPEAGGAAANLAPTAAAAKGVTSKTVMQVCILKSGVLGVRL